MPEQIVKPPVSTEEPVIQPNNHSRVGTTWLSLAVFAVILLLLVIFILQNNDDVAIKYFGWSGNVPFGVSIILSAIIGAILTLLIGSIRIWQLKMAARKTK